MKKVLKRTILFVLTASIILSSAFSAFACTSFYMGKGTTENGSYIWGRSEDINTTYRKLFYVQQAETHEEGEYYVSSTGFKWPYPKQTLRYTITPDSYHNERYTPQPYGEVGVNEKNVALSGTVTLSSVNSAITNTTTGDPFIRSSNGGLAETDLATVVLMQATSARNACELLAEIITTVGAAGREGVMISDPNEVWFFQMLSGHQYVAVKCPDNMIGFSPNVTGNVDLTNPANCIVSPGLVSVAEKAGTIKKDEAGNIKVADSYAASAPNHRTSRMRLGYNYLLGYDNEELMPASGTFLEYFWNPRAEKKYSLYEAMRLLAFRGEGTDWYAGTANGIGSDSTLEGHVFEVRPNMPDALSTIEWLCMAPPEFGIYLPYYGSLVTDVFEMYKGPDVNAYNNENPDLNSFFYVMRELYFLCKGPRGSNNLGTLEARTKNGDGVKAFWARYQKALIEQQAKVDEKMLALYAADPAAASEYATQISIAAAEEAYNYAKIMLKELKAFQAAETEGNFIPSVLNDESALPHYGEEALNLSVGTISTLVLGYAANLPITVTGAFEVGAEIKLTLSNGDKIISEKTITAEQDRKAFDFWAIAGADWADAAAGDYKVTAEIGSGKGTSNLTVVAAFPWVSELRGSNGNLEIYLPGQELYVSFDSLKVSLNGEPTTNFVKDAKIPSVVMTTVPTVSSGTYQIKLEGVRYPLLFPSFSFTYAVTYVGQQQAQ